MTSLKAIYKSGFLFICGSFVSEVFCFCVFWSVFQLVQFIETYFTCTKGVPFKEILEKIIFQYEL